MGGGWGGGERGGVGGGGGGGRRCTRVRKAKTGGFDDSVLDPETDRRQQLSHFKVKRITVSRHVDDARTASSSLK